MELRETAPSSANASCAIRRMCSRFCCASERCATDPPDIANRRTLRYVGPISGELSDTVTVGASMEYIKLGNTGLDVSPIAIGAMTYGEPDRGHPVWSKGPAEARPLIQHALEAGINFFDTANMY